MAFLTPQLLFQIKEIIRKHHTAFVANVFGHDAVPKDVLEGLVKLGLIDMKGAKGLDDAYLYGQAVAILEQTKVTSSSTMESVLASVKKNPVALTTTEQSAAATARLTGATYVVGLGNTIDKDTGQLLIEADHALREKLRGEIADKTALAIEARKTAKQLKSDLGYATQDWTRSLDRIAITETHNAMQQGVADGYKKRYGGEARVAIRPMPDACPMCKALHLGSDGHPKIFKLSQLAPPGANVKQPKSQWVACIGAVHPHCQCQLVRIPNGWGFDKDGSLTPGGRFGEEQDDDEEDDAEKSSGKVTGPIHTRERFVLEKALLTTGSRIAGSEVTTSVGDYGHNPTGAGTAIQGKTPQRPINPQNANVKLVLTDPGNMRSNVLITRDPKVYERQPRLTYIYPLSLAHAQYEMSAEADNFAAKNKDTLVRVAHQILDVPRNRVDPTYTGAGLNPRMGAPLDAGSEDQDAAKDDVDEAVEKALGHKYTSKTWHHGHWVYEYAEQHAGKVSEHKTDPNQIMVKFPKTLAGAKAANTLKGKHGVKGSVTEGGQYFMLPVHKDELAKPGEAKQAAPKPPKPKPLAAQKVLANLPPVSGTQTETGTGPQQAGFDHQAALDHITKVTGLNAPAIKTALTASSVVGDANLKQMRGDIVHALFQNEALLHKDALLAVLAQQAPGALEAKVDQVVKGSPKAIARAKQEYADVPVFDLATVSKVVVHDKTIGGYATAQLQTGEINIGVRPKTGDWATGDWRHELGHIIHGTFIGRPLDEEVIHTEWVKAIKRQKANPHGPDNADWFEEHWGVVGPRAVDSRLEFIAEAFRGYHRTLHQQKAGTKVKGSNTLDLFRTRHPTMSRFMDAHYTAALLGELAKKGAF